MGHNDRSGKRRRSADDDRRRSRSSSERALRHRRRRDTNSDSGSESGSVDQRHSHSRKKESRRKSHRGRRHRSLSHSSSSSSSSSSLFSSFSLSSSSSSSSFSSRSHSKDTGGGRKDVRDRSAILSDNNNNNFSRDGAPSNSRPILSENTNKQYRDYAPHAQKGILDSTPAQGGSGILGDLCSPSLDIAPIFADAADTSILHDNAYEQPIIQFPTEDWMCGICSNLNSVKRHECYRCGAGYVMAIVSQPCEELKLEVDHSHNASVGGSLDEMSFVRGFESVFAARQESCAIVDVVLKRMFSRPVGILQRAGEAQEADFVAAYVRFPSVDMARHALILCKCSLELNNGETVLNVQFSREQQTLERGSSEFLKKVESLGGQVSSVAVRSGGEQLPTKASKLANPDLPEDLQHATWTAPEKFETPEKEKEYLERLSAHWKHLSRDQRRFYETRVHSVLQAKATTATKPTSSVPSSEGIAAPSTPSAESGKSPQGKVALDSLKKRLEEKKKKMELSAMTSSALGSESGAVVSSPTADSPDSSPAPSSPSPTASKAGSVLAQRLAEKKARLLQQQQLKKDETAIATTDGGKVAGSDSTGGGGGSGDGGGGGCSQSSSSPTGKKERPSSTGDTGNGNGNMQSSPLQSTSNTFYSFPIPPSLQSQGVFVDFFASIDAMPHRKRVEFDEDNLASNEEYRRLHPVTMKIDEPKTPYVNPDDLPVDSDGEEYGFDEADPNKPAAVENTTETSWNPEYNQVAKEAKRHAAEVLQPDRPIATFSKSGRPQLSKEVVSGEAEQKMHEKEFKLMRKAVYADEGAKFKELLAHQKREEEEGNDDDS